MLKSHSDFLVSIDTPQLEQELKLRSPMVAELATYGATLKPDQISTEVKLLTTILQINGLCLVL